MNQQELMERAFESWWSDHYHQLQINIGEEEAAKVKDLLYAHSRSAWRMGCRWLSIHIGQSILDNNDTGK